MKKQIAILVSLLALLGSTFDKAIILAGFEVNRDYIAKNICVNRGNPSSCCRGKCFVKKKLQKEEAGDKSGSIKEKSESIWFFEEPASAIGSQTSAPAGYPRYVSALPAGSGSDLFHPPGKI